MGRKGWFSRQFVLDSTSENVGNFLGKFWEFLSNSVSNSGSPLRGLPFRLLSHLLGHHICWPTQQPFRLLSHLLGNLSGCFACNPPTACQPPSIGFAGCLATVGRYWPLETIAPPLLVAICRQVVADDRAEQWKPLFAKNVIQLNSGNHCWSLSKL